MRPAMTPEDEFLTRRKSKAQPPVQIRRGRPKKPTTLSPVASERWDYMLRVLSARKTLTKADGPVLELYAETFARWRAALSEIETYGLMVEVTVCDSSGESFTKRVMNPACKIAAQLEISMRALLKELGSTPASRDRAKPAPAKPKKDAMADFLDGDRPDLPTGSVPDGDFDLDSEDLTV